MFLVRYLHSKRIVIQLVTLVSNVLVLITVLFYIIDADLHAFNTEGNSIDDIVAKIQLLFNA